LKNRIAQPVLAVYTPVVSRDSPPFIEDLFGQPSVRWQVNPTAFDDAFGNDVIGFDVSDFTEAL